MQNLSRRRFLETGLKVAAAGVAFSALPMSNLFGKQKFENKWLLGMQGAKTMNCTLGQELEILSALGWSATIIFTFRRQLKVPDKLKLE